MSSAVQCDEGEPGFAVDISHLKHTTHHLSAASRLDEFWLKACGFSGSVIMQVIEEAKKRGQEKAKKTKSMIVMDVKPWDDTTGELTDPLPVDCRSGLSGALASLPACHLSYIDFAVNICI